MKRSLFSALVAATVLVAATFSQPAAADVSVRIGLPFPPVPVFVPPQVVMPAPPPVRFYAPQPAYNPYYGEYRPHHHHHHRDYYDGYRYEDRYRYDDRRDYYRR